MAAAGKGSRDLALTMLRSLPRVCIGNLRANPGVLKKVYFNNIINIENYVNTMIFVSCF